MRALSILPIYLATALAFQPSRRMALKTPVRPVVRHAVPTMSFATTTAPVIGALLTNGMYLAGVPAVQAARKKGSLGALNPLPFAMLLGNCVGWTSYGFLAEDYYLVAGNMPGILLGLWMYATALKVGTPGQRKLLNRVVKGLSGLFVGSIFTLALGPFAGDKPSQLKLYVAVVNVVGISFYASPLTALRGVLRARSSAALCAPMSAVAFANCCTWVYYGLAINSVGVVFPSAIGAVLSAVQLLCLLVYPSEEKPPPVLKANPAL